MDLEELSDFIKDACSPPTAPELAACLQKLAERMCIKDFASLMPLSEAGDPFAYAGNQPQREILYWPICFAGCLPPGSRVTFYNLPTP